MFFFSQDWSSPAVYLLVAAMQACVVDSACLPLTVCISFMRVQPSVFLDRGLLKQVVKCEASEMMAAAGGLAVGDWVWGGGLSPSGPFGSRELQDPEERVVQWRTQLHCTATGHTHSTGKPMVFPLHLLIQRRPHSVCAACVHGVEGGGISAFTP